MAEVFTAEGGLRFGIFDWLENNRGDFNENLETRLAMLEYADQAGFYAYHLAEHHGTLLSVAPAPNLFFPLVAQRTKRLRFGPMVYLLPMYHPIRLIEEICFLDQLSGGRLELGVGRNASPHEARLYGVDMPNSRAIAHEALDVVTQGLATGKVDFQGQHFQFSNVEVLHRPVQKPYPPLWWPTVNLESVPWIAQHGFSVFLSPLFLPMSTVGECLAAYRQGLVENAGKPGRLNGHVAHPNYGFTVQVVVADTDQQARRLAQEAHKLHHESFTYLWVKNGDAARHAARADFDTYAGQGLLIYGSPETVRQQLQAQLDVTGANYIGSVFTFGALKREEVMRSIHLFREQVMPRLARREVVEVRA